jgi:hypothetical protein
MQNERLRAALEYKARGFSVVPVNPWKRPLLKWIEFQRRRPQDEEIFSWFEKWPDANVAIVTGLLSDLTVIDCDHETATQLVSELLPKGFHCPIAKSPRGGKHFYLKHESRLLNTRRVFCGCDLRSERGYIVAPPSARADGVVYEWEVSPFQIDIPTMPKVLLNFLAANQRVEAKFWRDHFWGFVRVSRRLFFG